MDDVSKWIEPGATCDLSDWADVVAALPSQAASLNGIVQGLLVHVDWLPAYGLDDTMRRHASRKTLLVSDRIAEILGMSPAPLQQARPPCARAVSTCRDFALMLCAFLRRKGVPSRVRCGFAAYFGQAWEDHWVCEYWEARSGRWRRSDPQLDAILIRKLRIDFDPTDLPSRSFVTAGEAWRECRAGRADPGLFGHGDVSGLWFVGVNVVRDHYALNGREVSDWDRWREAPRAQRGLDHDAIARADVLAAFPEGEIVEAKPDWLK